MEGGDSVADGVRAGVEIGAPEKSARGLSAKATSKAFKWISAAGLLACAVLKWLGALKGADIGEICLAWSAVYALGAGTIDLNIMLDKFTGGAR